MTNYRFNMCSIHDKPQFNFCFTCGARLKLFGGGSSDYWACSREPLHVKIWIDERGIDENPDEECVNEIELA